MKYKSYLQGLKLAGIEEFLFELASSLNLDYKTIRNKRGIIRETIFFEVEGDKEGINTFRARLFKIVNYYNN